MKKRVKEGELDLEVDSSDIVSRNLEVFYNPKMALNRTLSVLLLKVWKKDNLRIALPLAGTGVRALRFLKELDENKIKEVYVNDLNPKTESFLNKNLKLNKLKDDKIIFTKQNAKRVFVEENGFDYVDIDPFGSPNPLLDGAIQKIGDGILAVTATDTAALAGTYIKTCIRKYWATPRLCPQKHEIGLRILARKVQLIGIQYNKALTPILSYQFEHYYRIFFKVDRGKIKANELFKKFGECSYNNKNGDFGIGEGIGPMYLGSLQNSEFISKMIALGGEEEKKLLGKLFLESSLNIVGHYDIHDVCEKNKIKSIKTDYVMNKLFSEGFFACRVHSNRYGIRTNASIEDFIRIVKD